MSQHEPTQAYAYQPEAVGKNGGAIFGVAGPGAEKFKGERFYSREDAQAVADGINTGVTTSAMLRALGNTPGARSAVNYRGR